MEFELGIVSREFLSLVVNGLDFLLQKSLPQFLLIMGHHLPESVPLRTGSFATASMTDLSPLRGSVASVHSSASLNGFYWSRELRFIPSQSLSHWPLPLLRSHVSYQYQDGGYGPLEREGECGSYNDDVVVNVFINIIHFFWSDWPGV